MERFTRVCAIPDDFRRGKGSLVDIVRASGYAEIRGEFATRELAEYLRRHPDVVDAWVGYSQDKRTTHGWYLRPPCSVGRSTAEPPLAREHKYVDLAAACAAFIVAELNDVLNQAAG